MHGRKPKRNNETVATAKEIAVARARIKTLLEFQREVEQAPSEEVSEWLWLIRHKPGRDPEI